MAFVPDPSYALGNSGYGYGYGAVMNSTSYSPTPPTKRRSSNKSNARRRRSSCSLSHRKRSSGSNRSFADEVQQPNVTQSMTPLTSPIEIPLSLSSFRLGATDKVTKVLDDAAPGVTALLMSGRDEQNRQRRGKEDTSWRPGQMYDGAGNICGERCGKRQVESDFDGKIGGRYQQPTRVELEGHSDLYRLARQTTVDVKEKCHVGGGGSNTPGTTIATSFAEIATSKVALPASTKNEGGEPQLGSTLSMRENQTLPAQQHPLMGVGVSNINESDVSSTIGSGHIFRPQPHPSIDHPSGCTQPRCTKRGEAKGDTPGPSAVNVRTQQNEKMESRQTAMLRHGATKEEVKVDGSDYSYSTDSCSAGDGPPNARDSTPISKHAEGGFSTRNEDVTNALHGGRREEESVQQIHGGIAEQENTSGRCETNHAGDGKRTGKDDSALEELGWKLVLSLPPSFEPEPREESSPLDREDTPLRQPVFMCGPDSGGGRPRIPEGRPRLGDVGLEDVGHNAVHTLTQVLGGEDESRATTREAQAADNLNLSPPWFLSPTSSDRTPPWCTSESRSTDVAARNNEQQSSGSSPPWGFTPTAGIVAPELPPLLNCRTAAPEHLQMDKTLSST